MQSFLPAAQLSPYFTMERTHCMPPQPGPQGAPTRVFILWLLNFRDQDKILRVARAAGELVYQNSRLILFPDYSMETQKLRRSFNSIKAALRAKGIKYSNFFLAKLRVMCLCCCIGYSATIGRCKRQF